MRHASKRHIGWGFALIGLLVVCGCGSEGVTTSPSLTPTGGSVGVRSTNTANWGGYVALQGDLTGVQATWTEPTLSGPLNAISAIWVGIGGWDTTHDEGLQIGVRQWLKADGTSEHRVWYQILPTAAWTLTDLTVAAGDAISASISLAPGATTQWQLRLHDTTSGGDFAQTVTHASARLYADYIVEDPNASANNGPPYYPLVQFTPVTFTAAQVCYGGACVALDSRPLLRLTMVQGSVPVVQPGPLTHDSFTVMRGN